MRSRKLKNKVYVSKSKLDYWGMRVEYLKERQEQEQTRSKDKSRYINDMIAQTRELEKQLEGIKEVSERNFKWFRIEEEKRIVLEQQLETAKKNIKVMTIGLYLLAFLIAIMNVGR